MVPGARDPPGTACLLSASDVARPRLVLTGSATTRRCCTLYLDATRGRRSRKGWSGNRVEERGGVFALSRSARCMSGPDRACDAPSESGLSIGFDALMIESLQVPLRTRTVVCMRCMMLGADTQSGHRCKRWETDSALTWSANRVWSPFASAVFAK